MPSGCLAELGGAIFLTDENILSDGNCLVLFSSDEKKYSSLLGRTDDALHLSRRARTKNHRTRNKPKEQE